MPAAKRQRTSLADEKCTLVARLLAAKEASGKTFDQIAEALGLTNTNTANLFYHQAPLKSDKVAKLSQLVPGISKEDLAAMQSVPMRGFDPAILQDPGVYRFYEAVTQYGEAMKAIVNEQCGDGIMSAIDFFMDVGTTTGKKGEKRVVITMNGKYLPYLEQNAADNTAPGPRD
ncbi:unnamed protein product [Polarella glacialis]|uniref:Cyanate hydratase n=1 Tax=Polarella glacialis TaxID=89957 RepID=A0A813K7N1_POLGL|nr:unnamed protein product [Polarella glacialis]